MTNDALAIVDVETTGGTNSFDRIIEIGILRIENGKIVGKFESLINPKMHLSSFITNLTGILPIDLENAPTFEDLKDEISELLSNAIFVAHNSRFDYAFLRSEFKRIGVSFKARQLCTVKLSRTLFPRYSRHSLDNIIERFGIVCSRRHRALDDALVVWEFMQRAADLIDEEKLDKAYSIVLKKPSLPPNLLTSQVDDLPETPGVYIFYGDGVIPLYIGKSVNVRDRVLSHFSNDTENSRELEINQQIKRIEYVKTAGELSALVLESELVKKLQPIYNRKLRYSRRLTYFEKIENNDGYFTVKTKSTNEIEVDNVENVLAILKSQKQAKLFLSNLIKEFSLCEKLLGLRNASGACFSYHLGWCKGACVGKESKEFYNAKFLTAFSKTKLISWPFKGAIVVKEKYEEAEDALVFDKWCYLGKYEEVLNSEKNTDMVLTDFDVYKILRGFFRDSKNVKKIFPFETNADTEFASL